MRGTSTDVRRNTLDRSLSYGSYFAPAVAQGYGRQGNRTCRIWAHLERNLG